MPKSYRLLPFQSDGDNDAWTHCEVVKRESSKTAEVAEVSENPCVVKQRSSVYYGDSKSECDRKLLVKPVVNLDIFDVDDVAKPHWCQKTYSPLV